MDENLSGNEATIELFHLFKVNENLYLKPDIQYVINPARTEVKHENALVGALRFGLSFKNERNMIQYILLIITMILVVGWVLKSLVKSFRKPKKSIWCEGCTGCQLKKEAKNGCDTKKASSCGCS